MRLEGGISREEFLARQACTRDLATSAGYAGVMVIGRSFYDRAGALAYLTNHFPPSPASEFDGVFQDLGHAVFVLPVEGPSTLVVDGAFYHDELVVADEVRVALDMTVETAAVLNELGLTSAQVGLVGEDILPSAFFDKLLDAVSGLDLIPDQWLLAQQRLVKSPAEQASLRQAAEVAKVGLQMAVEAILSGITERQVCAVGNAAALSAGADYVRYLRVHSGPWSAWPVRWPPATGRILESGDVVMLDIVGAYQGYGFEVRRTTVCGKPKSETRTLLEAAHVATERTVDAARPGVTAESVYRASCEALSESGFGDHLPSSAGHGIGLETVEAPQLRPGVDAVLKPGMVLCIEPGIFIKDMGGACVEQEVIVAESGPPEIITTFATRLW